MTVIPPGLRSLSSLPMPVIVPPGAYSGYDDIYFSVRIFPYFNTCCFIMGSGIGRVGELTGNEGARSGGRQILGFGDGSFHPLAVFCQDNIGSVGF